METNLSLRNTHYWISRRHEVVPGQPVLHQVCRDCGRGFIEESSTGELFAAHASVFLFHRLSDELHRDGFPRSVLANPCNKITPIGRPVSCWVRSILILFCDRRNTKRRPDALTQLGVSREFCIGSSSSPRGGGIRTPDAAWAPIPESLDSHISCVGPDAAKSQHEHMIVVFRIHQIAFLMNRLVQVRSVERVGQRQPSFRRSGSRVSGSGEPCMATVPARASQARRTFQAERSDAPRLLRAHPG